MFKPNINPKLWSFPRKIITLSLAILIISLTQSAFTYQDFNGVFTFSGINALLSGMFAIFGGGLYEWVIWLANPLCVVAAVLFLKNKKSSLWYAIIASFLALIFLLWTSILVSENGREALILHKNLGYWLWLLSMLTLMGGIIYHFKLFDEEPLGSDEQIKKTSDDEMETKYYNILRRQVAASKKRKK